MHASRSTPLEQSPAEQLRAWASRNYATEAAVELLIRAFDGRYARLSCPWVVEQDDQVLIDVDALTANLAAEPGPVESVLSVAAALLDPEVKISLVHVLGDLDREVLELVLAAVAHTAGSHDDHDLVYDDDDNPASSPKLPSAYGWPDPWWPVESYTGQEVGTR